MRKRGLLMIPTQLPCPPGEGKRGGQSIRKRKKSTRKSKKGVVQRERRACGLLKKKRPACSKASEEQIHATSPLEKPWIGEINR